MPPTAFRTWLALASLCGAGCGATGASLKSLEARATFDLQCPAPSIQTVEIDERTRGVRGCGKQMTYVEVCD